MGLKSWWSRTSKVFGRYKKKSGNFFNKTQKIGYNNFIETFNSVYDSKINPENANYFKMQWTNKDQNIKCEGIKQTEKIIQIVIDATPTIDSAMIQLLVTDGSSTISRKFEKNIIRLEKFLENNEIVEKNYNAETIEIINMGSELSEIDPTSTESESCKEENCDELNSKLSKKSEESESDLNRKNTDLRNIIEKNDTEIKQSSRSNSIEKVEKKIQVSNIIKNRTILESENHNKSCEENINILQKETINPSPINEDVWNQNYLGSCRNEETISDFKSFLELLTEPNNFEISPANSE
ncbi:uncharacterized protein MAL8P1.12-like [Centruroides sculpturatus]|uniref:uncharacterized protein MAL8P1.12-like n=1 Tax=Centruroides sculpturatus TaxID=218467 RepID=UPI000C6DBFF5|nr:uncharacterized protein MAL8P1.12-like [Centruroides sculpturatus]